MSGACEYGNELSGSIKCGEFLDQLQNQLASQEGLCSTEYVCEVVNTDCFSSSLTDKQGPGALVNFFMKLPKTYRNCERFQPHVINYRNLPRHGVRHNAGRASGGALGRYLSVKQVGRGGSPKGKKKRHFRLLHPEDEHNTTLRKVTTFQPIQRIIRGAFKL